MCLNKVISLSFSLSLSLSLSLLAEIVNSRGLHCIFPMPWTRLTSIYSSAHDRQVTTHSS